MNEGWRWRGWLVAAAIFILGLAVGSAGTIWIGVRIVRQRLMAPIDIPARADRAAARIGADLTRALDLTPNQSARIEAVLDESTLKLKAVRIHARTEAIAELRVATARIAAELPPEKRPKFYRLIGQRLRRLGLPASLIEQEPQASGALLDAPEISEISH